MAILGINIFEVTTLVASLFFMSSFILQKWIWIPIFILSAIDSIICFWIKVSIAERPTLTDYFFTLDHARL